MYNSADLTIDQCHALFEKLNNHSEKNTIPPTLGLLEALVVTLKYLRRNRVQAELAESHGVSQSTISRAIAHLKTWHILSTIHRHPYTTFETTAKATLGIIFGILRVTLQAFARNN